MGIGLEVIDARKRRILAAIVDEYVQTAQPVGSQAVVDRHHVRASTATVRNEMVKLEEAGLVLQPHISAGRIPSDLGYRFYVDHLTRQRSLSPAERRWVRGCYQQVIGEAEGVLKETSRLLSRLTKHPAVVFAPAAAEPRFRHISASPVNSHHVLVVYVTDSGSVEHRLVRAPCKVTSRQLSALSRILNGRLRGARISALSRLEMGDLCRDLGALKVPPEVIEVVRGSIAVEETQQVYVDGMLYILQEPEFAAPATAAEVVAAVESREMLCQAFVPAHAETDIAVRIGAENPVPPMQRCSFVFAQYCAGPGAQGAIGVLGPKRMDYGEALAAVAHVAAQLTKVLATMLEAPGPAS
jgi:heat-inducible transcriptional repressor